MHGEGENKEKNVLNVRAVLLLISTFLCHV
jgi:hypothetical protein